MEQKIIRDPVYDYISIDPKDHWLLDLLDTPEMQRLRYIHQLGVSYLVYPGATHTRFSHSLGVMHLMKEVIRHLEDSRGMSLDPEEREALLAVAVVHDVGHGPFSHLLEAHWAPVGETGHEDWSCRIIRADSTGVNRILRKRGLVDRVAGLLEKDEGIAPYWQTSLISSQLDVDRMDYLLRDSHFTGVGYGKYDHYRLIHTLTLEDNPQREKGQLVPDKLPVWPDKTKYALEEYVFARYYMYQSVYFHPCTRGYEKLLEAIWKRAKAPDISHSLSLLDPIAPFFKADVAPTVADYVRLQEYHVLSQIELWKSASDPVLAEICRMFLDRCGFKAVSITHPIIGIFEGSERLSRAREVIAKLSGDADVAPLYYLREDIGGVAPYKPYQWSAEEAQPILLKQGAEIREISEVLGRLKSVTKTDDQFVRYYCHKDYKDAVMAALS